MTQRYRITPAAFSPRRGDLPLAERIAYLISFFGQRLEDSEQQLAAASGDDLACRAYYTGRVDVLRLVLEDLKGVME